MFYEDKIQPALDAADDPFEEALQNQSESDPFEVELDLIQKLSNDLAELSKIYGYPITITALPSGNSVAVIKGQDKNEIVRDSPHFTAMLKVV